MNSIALMAADSASSASMTSSLIMFALIILIFYFLIYRPQKKRDKEAKAMLAAMKKGDKVVTIGGIHGTIVTVKDKTVVIKVDDSARIEFSKEAISSVTSKDAVKVAPEKKDKKAEEKASVEAKPEEAVKPEEAAKLEDNKEETK